MNGYVFTVCENGCEVSEHGDATVAVTEAVRHKERNPDEVVTVLVNLAQVRLDLAPGDAGKIADALDTLAGLDEGEHTDYEDLMRLRDLVRGQAVFR